MLKRFVPLLLTGCMVIGLAACGGGSGDGGSGDSASASGGSGEATADEGGSDEIVKLVVAYRVSGTVPGESDIQRVQEAISEITREKIGAEIQLVAIQSASYKQQMTLMLSGDEQLDCMFAASSMIPSAVSGEQLRDLEPLLDEYGQGIKDVLGEELLSCGYFNGTMYCIPTQTEGSLGMGYYTMRKDLVDKYNIDVDSIKSYDDLTEVFQLIHDNEPDITVVDPGSAGQSFMQFNCQWDKLGDYFGVLDNCGQDSLTVVNLFETENYKTFVNVMRDWYEKGFISADVTNSTESGAAKMKAGTLFAYANSNKPGIDTQEMQNAGCEVVGAQVLQTIKITNNNGQWCIPENSAYPEKAMQFLNLLYTDPDVINLLAYGIEGEDYVIHEDGRIGYPEGKDATTVGYSMSSITWALGNQFNCYVWETNDPDIWEQTKAYQNEGVESLAYGFVFDPTPVANQEAAVQNVYDQYRMSLECGVVDPESTLAEMNEKLYAAGLQDIIDEKQAQLDAWAEANGK